MDERPPQVRRNLLAHLPISAADSQSQPGFACFSRSLRPSLKNDPLHFVPNNRLCRFRIQRTEKRSHHLMRFLRQTLQIQIILLAVVPHLGHHLRPKQHPLHPLMQPPIRSNRLATRNHRQPMLHWRLPAILPCILNDLQLKLILFVRQLRPYLQLCPKNAPHLPPKSRHQLHKRPILRLFLRRNRRQQLPCLLIWDAIIRIRRNPQRLPRPSIQTSMPYSLLPNRAFSLIICGISPTLPHQPNSIKTKKRKKWTPEPPGGVLPIETWNQLYCVMKHHTSDQLGLSAQPTKTHKTHLGTCASRRAPSCGKSGLTAVLAVACIPLAKPSGEI